MSYEATGLNLLLKSERSKMKEVFMRTSVIVCLLTILLPGWSHAMTDSPTAEVKSTVDQVIRILTNPQYQAEAKREDRRKLLRDTILPRFDFQEMSKRALGTEWRRRTPEEQREFVKLFSDFLEKTYVRRIESYNNEKFLYIAEKIDGSYAEVSSKIVTTKGEEFKIKYMLHRPAEEWQVYDMVVEDISLINNYRSQFGRVIAQSSYQELVRRLKDKLAQEGRL